MSQLIDDLCDRNKHKAALARLTALFHIPFTQGATTGNFTEYSGTVPTAPGLVFIPWLQKMPLIAMTKPLHTEDVISAPFSGCYMASFTHADGSRRVAHIQTSLDPREAVDMTAAWNTELGAGGHVQAGPITIFRPQTGSNFKSIGLIDSQSNCYNILMDYNYTKVFEIYRMTPQPNSDIDRAQQLAGNPNYTTVKVMPAIFPEEEKPCY